MIADTCAGCGKVIRIAAAGGMTFIEGRPISYVLCAECARKLVDDPKEMTTQIELRLLETQGTA
jgi:hypothetical protein